MTTSSVLVIDDDVDVQELLTELLHQAGYEVTAADSVLGAIALAERVHPAVILLDLGLPYKSGASLLTDLKSNPNTAQIPVIVVSAMSEDLPRERRELAYAIVAKPFEGAKLLALVHDAMCGLE